MTVHTLGGTSTAADSLSAFSDGITPFTIADAINNGKALQEGTAPPPPRPR